MCTITSTSQLIEHKKRPTTYDIGNPGPGLEQTQKCGRSKPINGVVPFLSFHYNFARCITQKKCNKCNAIFVEDLIEV